MTQLINLKDIPLQTFYNAVNRNLRNPTAMFREMGELVESVTDGRVKYLDATNPTVLLAESAAVLTAAAVDENVANLRKRYPSLAESFDDLYAHMSDEDYQNRFSTPAVTPIDVLIGWSALKRDMVRDEAEKCFKAIIPRDTEFVAGTIPFTLQYPIVIRYFDTGTLSISYDADIPSPFQKLTTNEITYRVVNSPSGEALIHINIPIWQMQITTSYDTIQSSKVLQLKHTFPDQFYYARAFHRSADTEGWVELKTTHSDWIFDRREPTVVLKVEGNQLSATLPQIYTTQQTMRGDIRLQVYSSKGAIIEDLTPYDFTIRLVAIDTDRDQSAYTTQSLRSTVITALSSETVTGGKDALTLEQLRKRVIYNSVGPQNLPITNVELEAELENNGFDIIRNTDVVTNRVFLAVQELPKPRDEQLITAANIGVGTFVSEQQSLRDHPYVAVNGNRWTLMPKNLFLDTNGIIRMLSVSEITDLQNMEITAKLEKLNSNRYLYTPFHWVLDNSGLEFSSRPYYLENPTVSLINFVRQNHTMQLAVNSSRVWIERVTDGFKLNVQTNSGNFYKELPDANVSAQLMFRPEGATGLPVYLLGRQTGRTESGERIFQFDLRTNFDIDEKDRIAILGAGIEGNIVQSVWSNLEQDFNIFLCSNSVTTGYRDDESSNLIGFFQLPDRTKAVTHEIVTVTFGQPLKALWSRARTLATDRPFKLHEEDIPAVYPETLYQKDPITGSIITMVEGVPTYNILHNKGDIILDENGDPVLRYRKGQPVYDEATGAPVLVDAVSTPKELDILFIDGRHYFVTDQAYLDYNKELEKLLVTWIVDDLGDINGRLLDQTKVFFHPRNRLGDLVVDVGDGFEVSMPCEQSPELDLYVPESVITNEDVKKLMRAQATKILDTQLQSDTINNSDIEDLLREQFQSSVISLRLHGMGPTKSVYYGRVKTENARLGLKRVLQLQANGSLIMKEDVSINFYKAS